MSVGASIVVAVVGVGVCWSGCVSRAGGVEGGSVSRDQGLQGSGIDKSVDESIDGSDSEEASTQRGTPGRNL